MSQSQLARRVETAPKAELHVHLEGTLEADLSFALAERNGVDPGYADPDAMREAYVFHDLPSFLTLYYRNMNVLRTEADFRDLTYAYFERAAADHVVYAEPFFDPQAHTSRGVPFETVIRGIRQGQLDAARDLGVESGLIMCFLRDHSAESAEETLTAALPFKDWIVGVGLDSDEKDNPPEKFAAVFARARDAGLRLTMHCDVHQEDAIGHIRTCVEQIGVDRIDHGINVLEDEGLCRQLADAGMGFTVCPVSNHYVVQSLTTDEIRRMLAFGLRVTINSDDPSYFQAYLNDNFLRVLEEGDFDAAAMETMIANGFRVAWLDEAAKARHLQAVAQHFA
ncbi:MAG TPA: adenosine deaminase [Pseudomonadales bacterium]|nr:adenosine deaminase [Pseudomonadales bacterium]